MSRLPLLNSFKFALVVCCACLFVACDDDDSGTNSGTNGNSDIPEGSPLSEVGEDWYFVGWGMEIRTSLQISPTEKREVPLRTAQAFAREVGLEPDGLDINGLPLLPSQAPSTDFSIYSGPSLGEFAEDFDKLGFEQGSLHTWSSDGTGDYPAFEVAIEPVPAFDVVSPVGNSTVSSRDPLTVSWNGPSAGGENEFYYIHVYDQVGNAEMFLYDGNNNSYTVSAETMGEFSPGTPIQVQVNKYRFEQREIEGKDYFFGTLSSTQVAVNVF